MLSYIVHILRSINNNLHHFYCVHIERSNDSGTYFKSLGIRVITCEAQVTCDNEHSYIFSSCRQPVIENVHVFCMSSINLHGNDIS
jgi:hypothetical protein